MLTAEQGLVLGDVRAPQCRIKDLYMCSDSRYRSQEHDAKLSDVDGHFLRERREKGIGQNFT